MVNMINPESVKIIVFLYFFQKIHIKIYYFPIIFCYLITRLKRRFSRRLIASSFHPLLAIRCLVARLKRRFGRRLIASSLQPLLAIRKINEIIRCLAIKICKMGYIFILVIKMPKHRITLTFTHFIKYRHP